MAVLCAPNSDMFVHEAPGGEERAVGREIQVGGDPCVGVDVEEPGGFDSGPLTESGDVDHANASRVVAYNHQGPIRGEGPEHVTRRVGRVQEVDSLIDVGDSHVSEPSLGPPVGWDEGSIRAEGCVLDWSVGK